MQDFKDLLGFKDIEYFENYPLKNHSTFKVGGNCDLAAFPLSCTALKNLVLYLSGRYPFCVIGRGSNILVSDKGFKGVCIITDRLNKITLNGNIMEEECGVKISDALKTAADNNLGGLEFTVGIPGSIGGLVAMNGGCFNKTISDLVCFVKASDGVYNAKLCDFDYRRSRFLTQSVIISVGLKLKVSEEDIIFQKIKRFKDARIKGQPTGRSAGSIFLNQGYFAGKVIDKAGLKGMRIGGAYVSEKHANFIVCDGNLSADIFNLIRYIKETVQKTQGITLSEEVRYIGEF